MFVFLNRLGSLLVEVAEPLLGGGPPEKKHVDNTVKHVEGQATPAAPYQPDAPIPAATFQVAAAVSTGQVVRMKAEPPLEWNAAASEWVCVANTSLVLTFADGVEQSYDYPTGTAIRIAAGMIHFPQCNEPD